MRFGVTVDCSDLRDAHAAAQGFRVSGASRREAFGSLRSAGAGLVELQAGSLRDRELADCLAHARNAGLDVHFRGALHDPGHARYCVHDYARLLEVCRGAGVDRPLVVVHGGAGKRLAPIEHRQATVEMLNILADELPDIRFALKPRRRQRGSNQACDSCRTARSILDRCRRANIGFCWDAAHALANAQAFDDEFIPPADLVHRLFAVNVHGMVGGDAHHRLAPGNPPLDRVAHALREARYDGPVAYELAPSRLDAPSAYLDAVREDLGILREALGLTSLSLQAAAS